MSGHLKRLTTNRENYITTLARLFDYSTVAFSSRTLSTYVDGSNSYTYDEFRHRCLDLSHILSRFGVSAGDKVAILSQNMPNWTVAYFSVVPFGRVIVPILPDSSASEVENILRHSNTKVIYVSKRQLPKLSGEMLSSLTLVIDIETFEVIHKDDSAFTCEGWVKDPQADDLAAIIYTSGTSGKAKGVMLSHRNLCQNIVAASKAQKARAGYRWLSILPMSHAYEMAFSVLYPLYVGGCVYYIKKPPTPSILMDAMDKVRPHIMCSVPLIIEKVYKTSIVPTIKKSRILSWMAGHTPKLLYWVVGRRLKRTFGGKIRFLGIGGSKIDPAVEKFLMNCRFPYAIGYGLTETAPLVCNTPLFRKKKLESVGFAAYKVEIRLDDVNPATGEGELVCRGDNVMLGYYKDVERTAMVLDDQGWFHTNDVGYMDKDGYWFLKGRLNNTILGPSGENIYPEEIEMVINDMEGVDESLVMERDGKLVALVKFDDDVLDWNQESEDKFFEDLEARKKAVMDFVNKAVGKNSRIGEVDAMKEPFEKTATQKIRRFKYKGSLGDAPEKKCSKEDDNKQKTE